MTKKVINSNGQKVVKESNSETSRGTFSNDVKKSSVNTQVPPKDRLKK